MRTRLFGFDVHREFTQIARLEGDRLTHLGRIPTTPEALRAFAQALGPEDHVVLEATTNTYAIVQVLQQHAGRVIVSNPLQTRAIADAKINERNIAKPSEIDWLEYIRAPLIKGALGHPRHRCVLADAYTKLSSNHYGP